MREQIIISDLITWNRITADGRQTIPVIIGSKSSSGYYIENTTLEIMRNLPMSCFLPNDFQLSKDHDEQINSLDEQISSLDELLSSLDKDIPELQCNTTKDIACSPLTYDTVCNNFIRISNIDSNGDKHAVLLSEIEFENAAQNYARQNRSRDGLEINDIMSDVISQKGTDFVFNKSRRRKDNTSSITRGFVVYLLQTTLGCPVNRVDSISAQVIGSLFGLGSNGSGCERQVRRYRSAAAQHIKDYVQLHTSELNDTFSKLKERLCHFIHLHLKEALDFVHQNSKLIKKNAPRKKGETVLNALRGNTDAWVDFTAQQLADTFTLHLRPLN